MSVSIKSYFSLILFLVVFLETFFWNCHPILHLSEGFSHCFFKLLFKLHTAFLKLLELFIICDRLPLMIRAVMRWQCVYFKSLAKKALQHWYIINFLVLRKLSLFWESAKLLVLRIQVPTCLGCFYTHVLICLSYLRVHVPCVLTYQRVLRAYVLGCQRLLLGYVITWRLSFRALVLICFTCSRVNVSCVSSMSTYSRAITVNNKYKFSMTCLS